MIARLPPISLSHTDFKENSVALDETALGTFLHMHTQHRQGETCLCAYGPHQTLSRSPVLTTLENFTPKQRR